MWYICKTSRNVVGWGAVTSTTYKTLRRTPTTLNRAHEAPRSSSPPMAEPTPEHGEVPAPDTAGDAPSSNANGAHRTPEELIAKAIAPVKGEFLRPPPVRPYSSGQSDAAPEARGGAPQSGLVKEKKSKRQLKRERQQVSPLSLSSRCL